MATNSISSNEGTLKSASAVLEVSATNPEYNQPALHIKQAGKHGGASSIRIDDPNPDIELTETDQIAPAGKYEIAVQTDKLQINGRNANDTAFETLVVFERPAAGGNIGVRSTSQFGGGQGVVAIANANVPPSRNPAGGGILYVESGALKYRGSNGTATVLAPPRRSLNTSSEQVSRRGPIRCASGRFGGRPSLGDSSNACCLLEIGVAFKGGRRWLRFSSKNPIFQLSGKQLHIPCSPAGVDG